jgi:hypothetical protein
MQGFGTRHFWEGSRPNYAKPTSRPSTMLFAKLGGGARRSLRRRPRDPRRSADRLRFIQALGSWLLTVTDEQAQTRSC